MPPGKSFIRRLSKPASVREVGRNSEHKHRTAAYSEVREDSGTESINKFLAEVEFEKNSISRWQNWLLISCLILLSCLNGCTSSTIPAPVSDGLHQGYHRVSQGETLYSIAFRYGLDYRNIARLNHLASPYKIHAGDKLRLSTTSPHTSNRYTSKRKPIIKKLLLAKTISKPSTLSRTKQAAPRTPYVKLDWQWPARGSIISTFTPSVAGNNGIDIAGQFGQPISASAPGYVVYCGSGLRGYGQLIIIKHSDTFLSAYAHNSQLLVKEGMYVKAGQLIAKMGNSDSSRIKLHFEIRYAGKPVNPLSYLPKNRK